MVSTFQLVGFLAFAALVIAWVVVGVIALIKGRRGHRRDKEDGGGFGIMSEGSTPGSWDGGSHS